GVAPGIADRIANAVRAAFGDSIQVEVKFINLPDAYVLKTNGPLRLAAQNKRSKVYREGRLYLALRKDRMKGMKITYPAVMLRQRTSFD
ncbi:MAG: hypothetical protein ING29_19145, partial [Azospirillum sp.]|nr:hypothetical protein [Azospirillum sp.]